MNTPRISAIASIGENRELGKGGALIWRISDDLTRLKQLTQGHAIIMGRRTYESIGKPLPNRTNIIVTRNTSFVADGCVVVHSLDEALTYAREIETEEIFIFGGAEIYKEALPHIDRLYLTTVHAEDPDADAFFPDYSEFTKVVETETRGQGGLAHDFVTLERHGHS